MSEEKKRVLVADDHAIVREGLARLLEKQPDLELCGEVATADSVIPALHRLRPDALVLDLSLGSTDGLENIKQIRSFHPNLPILVLSMHEEERYAERAIRAGANGYAMKQQLPDEILNSLRLVLHGELALSPRVTTRLVRAAMAQNPPKERDERTAALSDRELHVFQQMGLGKSTREIAEDLNLSKKTVETYQANIKIKLGLRSGVELIRAAEEWVNSES